MFKFIIPTSQSQIKKSSTKYESVYIGYPPAPRLEPDLDGQYYEFAFLPKEVRAALEAKGWHFEALRQNPQGQEVDRWGNVVGGAK
jgi:hypothetical protein